MHRDHNWKRALSVALLAALAACAGASGRNEVYRLPASYNFAFYDNYPEAARSFYAAARGSLRATRTRFGRRWRS